MSPAAQLAQLLSQRFVKDSQPNLLQLCKDLGLRLKEMPFHGIDGALIRGSSKQKGIVAVNAAIREVSRKRFTIAHEIGHFIMPHHRNLPTFCDEKKIESFYDQIARPEVEANEFAAELLLPSAVLRRRFNLSEFSLQDISTVATEFQTSLTATTRSFLGLTHLPCAMVWSVANQAKWCARSEAFRFFLPLAELPAPGSYAAKLFAGGNAPAEFCPVSPIVWLERRAAEAVEVLLEHSIALPNYSAVLTLLWAERVLNNRADEEEDSLLDELDPQSFTLHRKRWPR